MAKRPVRGTSVATRRIFVGVAALALLVSGLTIAQAASLGTILIDSLGTSAGEFVPCPGISTAIKTSYRPTGTRYEISQVQLTSVPVPCRQKPFRLTIAQGDAAGTIVTAGTELTGTTANSATTTLSWTSGSGPLLGNVNNSPGTIKSVLVVTS